MGNATTPATKLVGNNKMLLNEATMKAALQMWFDSLTIGAAATVTRVAYVSTGSGIGDFEVTLASKPSAVEGE